jgi:hypothetical protein
MYAKPHPAIEELKVLKKTIIYLLALAVIVSASAFLHVFYISDGGDGTLFWRGDTAYLFLDLGRLGYRLTYLQYVGQSVKEVFGVGRGPSDERYSNVVFTINRGNVGHYVLDDMRLSEFYVVDGSVLSGDLNTGALWKWNNNHFERATAQDQRDLTAAGAASRIPGPDYDDVDGWHKRCCFFTRRNEYSYVINLDGATLSLRARRERVDDLSIELLRSDGTKETIWHLDGHPRRVSKTEYEQAFGKR